MNKSNIVIIVSYHFVLNVTTHVFGRYNAVVFFNARVLAFIMVMWSSVVEIT